MKRYITNNKATVFSLSLAGGFITIITAAALILSEVSPGFII